jgi:hypothetical protein
MQTLVRSLFPIPDPAERPHHGPTRGASQKHLVRNGSGDHPKVVFPTWPEAVDDTELLEAAVPTANVTVVRKPGTNVRRVTITGAFATGSPPPREER